ncbi:MAG TPA: gamma-glutamyltransferase, partial [Ilumatobacteraceae bacterium]|nr:gamma-glutamyltransferase [Ilumatobacteraceae bacterium]
MLLFALGVAACRTSPTPPASSPASVEAGALRAGVTAANPIAVDAGIEVLRKGGSAVDAAVAVQAALGLVEPQSSGLGGGAFLLYYDAKTRTVTAFNGRET